MKQTSIDKLMEIKKLYEAGILTKEEMEQEKQKILYPVSEIEAQYREHEAEVLQDFGIYAENSQSNSTDENFNGRTFMYSEDDRNENTGVAQVIIFCVIILIAFVIIFFNL